MRPGRVATGVRASGPGTGDDRGRSDVLRDRADRAIPGRLEAPVQAISTLIRGRVRRRGEDRGGHAHEGVGLFPRPRPMGMSTKTWRVPSASADGHVHEGVGVFPRPQPRPMGMLTKGWACPPGRGRLSRFRLENPATSRLVPRAGVDGRAGGPGERAARGARIGQPDFHTPDPGYDGFRPRVSAGPG